MFPSRWLGRTVLLATLAWGAGRASAALPLPIDNPGFEDPLLAEGDWSWSMDDQGWGYYNNDGYQGAWNPGLNVGEVGYSGQAPQGQNVGWTNPGGVGIPGGLAQVLTDPAAVLKPNLHYTLTVEVGHPSSYPWGGYIVQLLAGGTAHTPGSGTDYTGPVTGGTLLAEDNNSLVIVEDTFATSIVQFTFDPVLHDPGLLGLPLQIRLLSAGNVVADDETEADFDNVRLTVEPVLPGDFNLDAQVEQTDLNLLLAHWGASTVPPQWTAPFDGLVDQNELNDLLAHWGLAVGSAQPLDSLETAVPEPATLGLLAGLAVGMSCRRTRSRRA